jgi:hypothetical protein
MKETGPPYMTNAVKLQTSLKPYEPANKCTKQNRYAFERPVPSPAKYN